MGAAAPQLLLVLYHEPVLTAALAPRYQYLPLAFLALMLCIALASLRSGSRAAARTVYAAAVVWVLAAWPPPGLGGNLRRLLTDDAVEGRPIRFLVSDDDWQRAQQRGGRIAALVDRRAQVGRPG